MLPVGFEPTISAGERPKTYALDRAATGIGRTCYRTLCNNPEDYNLNRQVTGKLPKHSTCFLCVKTCTVILRLTSDPANEFFG